MPRVLIAFSVLFLTMPHALAGDAAFECPGPVDLPEPLVGDHLVLTHDWFDEDLSELELWSVEAVSMVRALTVDLGIHASLPAWSPDLTRIAFTGRIDSDTRIWIVDVDGTDPRVVSPGYGSGPSWSPDGHRLAYGTPGGIVVNDLATCEETVVATDTGFVSEVQWSPTGDLLVFERRVDEMPAQLYGVDPAGGELVQLTEMPGGATGATFSPDGTRIAFKAFGVAGSIWVVNADGSDPQLLYDTGSNDFDPSFSPEGGRVASEAITDQAGIQIVDLGTGEAHEFTAAPFGGFRWSNPVWNPPFRKVDQPVPTDVTTTTSPAPETTTTVESSVVTESGSTGAGGGIPLLFWVLAGASVLFFSAAGYALWSSRSQKATDAPASETPPPPATD